MSSRRGRAARIWITIIVVVVALGGLLVVADVVVRNIAEQRVGDQLEQNLPDGVEGDVDVTIGGFSVIAQYLSGSMDRVELSAPELTVAGVPISVEVEARDVPPGLDGPVGHVVATIDADEASVNHLVRIPGVRGELAFGDGTVGYSDTIEVFGFPIDYTAIARPVAAGDEVLLEPVDVEVGAGGGAIDVSDLVDRLLGDDPIPVCVAEYLPEGVEVNDIQIGSGAATVRLEAQGISFDEASLARSGSCD
jgi:hypothetical protein